MPHYPWKRQVNLLRRIADPDNLLDNKTSSGKTSLVHPFMIDSRTHHAFPRGRFHEVEVRSRDVCPLRRVGSVVHSHPARRCRSSPCMGRLWPPYTRLTFPLDRAGRGPSQTAADAPPG